MKKFFRARQAQIMAALIMAIVVWATTVGLGSGTGIVGAAPVASRSSTGIAGASSLNHRSTQKTPIWWTPPRDPNGALRTPLTTDNRGCNFEPGGTPGTGNGTGFVIINKTGSGMLVTNVVLMNAAPNATYAVRLIQTPNAGPVLGSDCLVIDGFLSTDAEGDGQVNIHETVLPGSHDAWVDLNNLAAFATDFYTTRQELFF